MHDPGNDEGRNLIVGLIGTGEMARFYAPVIRRHLSGIDLAAVSSQSLERATAFAETFGIPDAYGRHAGIFQDDLDAVIIASASDTHAGLIEEAARRNIHVFCEKPLGVTLEEIDAAVAAANGGHIHLATGFNRRFDPAFQQVHEQVTEGAIGTPESIVLISRDPGIPTMQEMATPNRMFVGTTIHDLDMARFLMQDEVEWLTAQGSWLSEVSPETDQVDVGIVSLRFRRGGLGTIVNSWRSNEGYDQRVELHGSRGLCRVENVSGPTLDVPREAAFFVKRYAASYLAELKAFFSTLREGTWQEGLATGFDGRMASRLSEAAIESWKRHTVVCI